MSRVLLMLGLVLLMLVICPLSGNAKIGKSSVAPPVQIDGIEFSASKERQGFIEARSIDSHKLLWRKRAYYTIPIPFAEDSDRNCVKRMSVAPSGKELIIMSERGGTYRFKTTPPVDLEIPATIATVAICFLILALFQRRRSMSKRPINSS